MTKHIHIHVHGQPAKTRDAAGDGKEKWITINGAHVKIDGKGEITQGPAALKNDKPGSSAGGRGAAATHEKKGQEHASEHRAVLQARTAAQDPTTSKEQQNRAAVHYSKLKRQYEAKYGKLELPGGPKAEGAKPAASASSLPRVDAGSLKEGQALYNKQGQKVDEIVAIRNRRLGNGMTLETRSGTDIHINPDGSNAQGFTNVKPGAGASTKSPVSGGQSSSPAMQGGKMKKEHAESMHDMVQMYAENYDNEQKYEWITDAAEKAEKGQPLDKKEYKELHYIMESAADQSEGKEAQIFRDIAASLRKA